MKTLVFHKVAVLAAVLAFGGAGLANDAVAKGGGGYGGGSHDGGGVHHFVGSVRDHGFNGRPAWAMTLRPASLGGPGTHGYNCWKSHGIPTNSAWRQRHAEDGTCY